MTIKNKRKNKAKGKCLGDLIYKLHKEAIKKMDK